MNIFTPNTDCFSNYYDKEKYLLAWRISISFSTVFLFLLSIQFFQQEAAILPVAITFFVSFSSSIFLRITKKFKILYWIYAITGSVVANFAMNYVVTSTHYVDFIWMMVCIFIALIGLGRKAGLIFTIANVLGISYFYFFTLNDLLISIGQKSTLGLVSEFLEMIFAVFVLTYLMYKFALFQTIYEKELKIATKVTAEKTNENEVLIKEIHHRVKNNLQIIISLLRLQKNEIKSDEAKKHFNEAINRIMVMSLIHQKLYNDKSLADISIKEYLNDLTHDILTLSTIEKTITIQVESNIEKIGLKTIVPLGLLVNELVSNSIQHAFANKNTGLIKISIENKKDNHFNLNYIDNGKWKPIESNYSSFGIELIGILASQLDGDYSKSTSNQGTTYNFNLKNNDISK